MTKHPSLHHLAHFCAYRVLGTSENTTIEILLTRNNFWNAKENKPRDFAGEWMFPSLHYKQGDLSLVNTASRAFREQLSYSGVFHGLSFIRSYDDSFYDEQYHEEYYAAQLDSHEFTLPENGPLIEYRWFSIPAASEYISSDAFSVEQKRAFREHGLNDACLGPHALFIRQLPLQTLDVLLRLREMPHLLYAIPVEREVFR